MKLILIIGIIIIGFFLIKDYNRRMVEVNANYMCNVAGDDQYCNLLNEIDMRKEVK